MQLGEPSIVPEFDEESAALFYIDYWDDDQTEPHLVVHCSSNGEYYRLKYDCGIEFVIDEARGRIQGSWCGDFGKEDATLFLVGPVLGFLLRLRGITSLHAGAIVRDDRALAIVGPSGAGKSTLTAILARQGNAVLTDDVLPISLSANGFTALPGYPRLRIRPEVAAALFGRADAIPRLSRNWSRRFLDLTAEGFRFYPHPAPLGAVYLLDRIAGALTPPSVHPLNEKDSFLNVIANIYRSELSLPRNRRDEFFLIAELAQRVPVRRVIVPEGLGHIEQIATIVVNDFGSLHCVQS